MNPAIDTLNQWGAAGLEFAVAMFWQSSLLVLVLLALDFGLRHRVRASVRHALWLVLLVKLVLPPALALPTSPAWWLSRATAIPLTAPELPARDYTITQYDLPPLDQPAPLAPAPLPPPPSLSLPAWVLLLAGTVSLILLGWLLLRWRQVIGTSRAALPDAELSHRLVEARQLANFPSSVPVKLTSDTMSPAVCGLFRPVILLPQSLADTLSPEQLRAVLLHELMHMRRGDVWVNFAQALLQIVYWWHPLVWLANARLRRVREEAVDEAVMVALRADAEIYAPTLLAVAKFALQRPLASLGLVGILESRSALSQRIERLVNFPVPQRAGLGFLAALGIVAFSAIALPMGDAPPLPPPMDATPAPASMANSNISTAFDNPLSPATPAEPAPGQTTPWPDPQFAGYHNVSLLAHFLIVDQASLLQGVPTLANLSSPAWIPPREVDGLLTQLKKAGARFYNNYPGGLDQPGLSGGSFRYLVGGVTNALGSITWETTNVAGRQITSGWEARLPATQPDWTPMDFTVHPLLAGNATRCQFRLLLGGQVQTPQHSKFRIPLGGALAWAVPNPAQPGKCQVVLLVAWDATNPDASSPFVNRTFSLPAADLSAAWHARGWSTTRDDDASSMLHDFIYAAGLNWLPPRHFTYTNDELAVTAPVRDLDVIASILLGIRPPGAPPFSPSARPQAGTLVQEGKVLYEMGKLAEAEAKLKAAIKLDPENTAAFYYLNLIQQAQAARTNQTLYYSGPGRQNIVHKLETIRLPTVAWHRLPLTEVLLDLSAQVTRLDPDHAGINFLINSRTTPLADQIAPATGLPVTNAPAAFDVGAVPIQMNLTNVRVADVLDAIVLVAGRPLKYSIQDFAVVFSAKPPDTGPPLYMRTFKVTGDIFFSVLPPVSSTGTNVTSQTRAADFIVRLREYFRTRGVDLNAPKAVFYNEHLGLLFFKATETDLDLIEHIIANLNQQHSHLGPGSTNGSTAGILSNPKFQTAIHALEQRQGFESLPEPEVTTTSGHSENRLYLANLWVNLPAGLYPTNASPTLGLSTNLVTREFPVDRVVAAAGLQRALGETTPLAMSDVPAAFQRLCQRSGLSLTAPMYMVYNERQGILLVKATRDDLAVIEKLWETCLINVWPQLHIKTRFIEIMGDDVHFPTLTNFQTAPNLAGILAPAAVTQLLKQLRTQPGFTELAEPEVTTTTGRQTQMRATQVTTIITGINPKALTPPGVTRAEMTNPPAGLFEATNREFGPITDLVPYVLADGYTVNLKVVATDPVFTGYDQATNKVRIYIDDPPKSGDPATIAPPRPHIIERQFVSTANLYDGQTLILSQPVDPRTGLPLEPTGKKAKHLIVLATVALVDPAGNRVHTDAELSFTQNRVPPAK